MHQIQRDTDSLVIIYAPLPVIQSIQAFQAANPDGPIRGDGQTSDTIRRTIKSSIGFPGLTVKAGNSPVTCPKPNRTIRSQRHSTDVITGQPIFRSVFDVFPSSAIPFHCAATAARPYIPIGVKNHLFYIIRIGERLNFREGYRRWLRSGRRYRYCGLKRGHTWLIWAKHACFRWLEGCRCFDLRASCLCF